MKVTSNWYHIGLLEHARAQVEKDGSAYRFLTTLIDAMRSELFALSNGPRDRGTA